MRFQAALHGIDLDKETGEKQVKKKATDGFKFGDPDSYKDMSQEEREALTQQMMAKHKAWDAVQKPMRKMGKRNR